MPLHFAGGSDAQRGGLDVTIHLPYQEALVVGPADADELANFTGVALWGLSLLRTGKNRQAGGDDEYLVRPVALDDFQQLISHLESVRTSLLTGLTAAAIRAHHAAGGSVGDLALAMDTARSTAQARRDKVLTNPASAPERWATAPTDSQQPAGESWSWRIELDPEEAKAVGFEAQMFADWIDTALWALSLLRTGFNPRAQGSPRLATLDSWHGVINDLVHRLEPRIKGITDAAVRTHDAMGGSLTDLATAMGVPYRTAQKRRDALTSTFPSGWERWALTGGAQGGDHAEEDAANPAFHVPMPAHVVEVRETAAKDGHVGTTCNCGWTSNDRTLNAVEAAQWGEDHKAEMAVKDTTLARR